MITVKVYYKCRLCEKLFSIQKKVQSLIEAGNFEMIISHKCSLIQVGISDLQGIKEVTNV